MDAAQISTVTRSIRTLAKYGVNTVAEANVYFTALKASEVDKNPKTMAQIVKETGIPFSTASRLAWALQGQGLLVYKAHPTDRRKKLLIAKNINGG